MAKMGTILLQLKNDSLRNFYNLCIFQDFYGNFYDQELAAEGSAEGFLL